MQKKSARILRLLSCYLPEPSALNTASRLAVIPLFSLVGLAYVMIAGSWLYAAEPTVIRPAGIWSDAQCVPSKANKYRLENLIDGNKGSYSFLLDTSRTGQRETTTPPRGDMPVTATIVLDLGKTREIAGVRFITCREWRALGVKNVSVFTCSDPQGKKDVKPVCQRSDLLPLNYGQSVPVTWNKIKTRYLGIQIKDSWQVRDIRQGLAEENVFDLRLAEIECLTEPPEDPVVRNDNKTAFPQARLLRDWILQDCGPQGTKCFRSDKDATVEKAMLEKVLSEVSEYVGSDDSSSDNAEGQRIELKSIKKELALLLSQRVPGKDARWNKLYRRACMVRRAVRLSRLLEETNRVIYVKHHVFGGTEGLDVNPEVTDRQFRGTSPEVRPGSQLCMLVIHKDGRCDHEVLLDKPNGLIRDPNLSYDAKTLLFSMRNNFTTDDYHLFSMDMASRAVRQLTFTPEKNGRKYPCGDMEPCFTPTGNIVFTSSRNSQINDCWPATNTNIYTCGPNGENIRRLTYDELAVYHPQVIEDGRIVFTRWEYNDRNAYFLHPLFTMNEDGSMQTEYVGNNSMYPASILHTRSIPGSSKLVGIVSGHHVPSKGKLALIDRTLGTQDGKFLEYVAGASPDGTPGRAKSTIVAKGFHDRSIDYFGQKGPQFQYPFPLDEDHYLVTYSPEGWPGQSGPYNPPFGIYFMNADGHRELLAFDWWVSSAQPVPVMERDVPSIKPSQIDPAENFGTYIVQDIYIGPGLKGIPRGTVKKLRVIALEYRAGWAGTGPNAGESDSGYIQTPISMNNGSWDVKHVLGQADIESDGSVAFKVPARTPVYFQLIDEKGYCVQTMRSWSTLQGGEVFSCLGCHEDKLETGMMERQRPMPLALKKAPQMLKPAFGRPHPLVERLKHEKATDSVYNYLGVNAPVIPKNMREEKTTPIAGFSYVREIQPVLDRHCTTCHSDKPTEKDTAKISTLDLTGRVVTLDVSDPKILAPWYFKRTKREHYNGIRTPLYIDWKRDFTQSYVALTNYGYVKGNRFIEWLEVRSRSEMLPPYHTGACKSNLMKYLEPDHYGVQVSRNEKEAIAAWIDLLIPFCGSYTEGNTWSGKEREIYRYFLEKRYFFANQEIQSITSSKTKKAKAGSAVAPQ